MSFLSARSPRYLLMGYRAVVLGASGYAGSEILRLLQSHPSLEVLAAGASSRAGQPILLSHYSPRGGARAFVPIEEALATPCDILFASLPHTASMGILGGLGGPKIVDLGGDFRLNDPNRYERWYGTQHSHPDTLGKWVYGLTELNRGQIQPASRVANPGCYPAAALLVLAPLLAAGAIRADGIHIDAKSGVSGAGRAGGEGFDFCAANENVRPYSVTGHKHIGEIEQELEAAAGERVTVSFVPHLVPLSRGLSVTCVASAAGEATGDELTSILEKRYSSERFVRVLPSGSLPETKRLMGTNFAEVGVEVDGHSGRVLCFSALDNLGKGAAGQAIQNANLMLGLPEEAGLEQGPWVP
ncbi:MAG: N-acetyl-gamma-glutamyl-phosphate reductase [Actinomycetota bacterium]|nr:N-acetyl-gamma-glutamyl-phosphate reductase [Actinomycetota bacterium]